MKYVILIYAKPDRWGYPALVQTSAARELVEPKLDQLTDRSRESIDEIAESGELLDGAMLGDPLDTSTTQLRDDVLTTRSRPLSAGGRAARRLLRRGLRHLRPGPRNR